MRIPVRPGIRRQSLASDVKTMKRITNFIVALLFNMLLGFKWSLPAWVLLVLHFTINVPIVWFFVALGLWVLCIISGMWVIGWARECGNIPDQTKENKNPYSAKNQDFNKK